MNKLLVAGTGAAIGFVLMLPTASDAGNGCVNRSEFDDARVDDMTRAEVHDLFGTVGEFYSESDTRVYRLYQACNGSDTVLNGYGKAHNILRSKAWLNFKSAP